MTSFNRLASALAFSGIVFATTSALAAPAELVAQTTVPSSRSSTPGQRLFEVGLEAYHLNVETDISLSGNHQPLTSAAPACIATCLPWVNLNGNF